MWSKRVSGGTLSDFIWEQRVSEQIDARVWVVEREPENSRRETESVNRP
jgi:hypothetical protein